MDANHRRWAYFRIERVCKLRARQVTTIAIKESSGRMPEVSLDSAQAESMNSFLALSRLLTGFEELDATLGRQYLDRLIRTPAQASLRRILEIFRELGGQNTAPAQVKQHILTDDSLRPTVCQIVLLWYTSAMQDNPDTPSVVRYGTQEQYFSGLAWQAIGAHVPGLSGGYFGHWRYRPDNEPVEAADGE